QFSVHAQSMLDDLSPEGKVLQPQIARFTRELPRAELRASLGRRRDLPCAAHARRRAPWDARRVCSSHFPLTQPLLWAYRLRGRVRNRTTAPPRSAPDCRPSPRLVRVEINSLKPVPVGMASEELR